MLFLRCFFVGVICNGGCWRYCWLLELLLAGFGFGSLDCLNVGCLLFWVVYYNGCDYLVVVSG